MQTAYRRGVSVKRFDSGSLQKPQYLSNGWVRVDAWIARTGLLEYARADGSRWVEYRPPAEHSPDALQSFDAVPFTNNHPPAGMLDAENTKLYQVGTVLSPRADGEKVRASILVTDAATVAAIKSGKVELSCGYSCDVDSTPGTTPEGQHYDALQTNVRGNHVALVTAGRAGPEVRLRLDGVDPDLTPQANPVPSETVTAQHKGMPVHKIKIDGVEFEVSESAAQAVSKLQASVSELSKAIETEKVRADAAAGEVTKLKAELVDAPVRVRAEMQARAELENKAREVLGTEFKADAKTDLDIKREVAISGGFKLDGKADAYVDAAFELTLTKSGEAKEIAKAAQGTSEIKTDVAPSVDDARKKHNEFLQNLHRNHLERK